jgi:hypothetical protein
MMVMNETHWVQEIQWVVVALAMSIDFTGSSTKIVAIAKINNLRKAEGGQCSHPFRSHASGVIMAMWLVQVP